MPVVGRISVFSNGTALASYNTREACHYTDQEWARKVAKDWLAPEIDHRQAERISIGQKFVNRAAEKSHGL